MPRRCVLGGCSNTTLEGVRLHLWPNDKQLSRTWTKFVQRTRVWTGPSKFSYLCSAHFEPACYIGSDVAISCGYVPVLKADAFPTILPQKTLASAPLPLHSPSKFRKIASSGAFKKRERSRVLDEITDSTVDMVDDAQAEFVDTGNCSMAVQVQPDVASQGVQVWMKEITPPKPKMVSTAVQCNILKTPRPLTTHLADSDSSDEELEERTDEGAHKDPDYDPKEDDPDEFLDEEESEEQAHKQSVYLVYESSLMELFAYCPCCKSECTSAINHRVGSQIQISQTCIGCSFVRTWNSQPLIGKTPAGNLLISSALLFSGSSATKTLLFLKHLRVTAISYNTYINHQSWYLQPAIQNVWDHEQARIMDDIKCSGRSIRAAADGRADSPGHSAQYGTYTLLDTTQGKVIHFELVAVTEVANSNAMELEGLKRALKAVTDSGLSIEELTTDRHVSIRKYLREQHVDIKHSLDVWHTAKVSCLYDRLFIVRQIDIIKNALSKKIDKLGKKKGFQKVNQWKQSITNHMYWCARSTIDGDPDLLEAKWLSITNHIQNVHTHGSDQFPNCLHGQLQGRERQKDWMNPNDKDTELLHQILVNKAVLKDTRMLSTTQQTSSLESFHAVINHFAPKMMHFSYHGMRSRMILSALHFNENAGRRQSSKRDGTLRHSLEFPKYKKGAHRVKKVLISQTYNYVDVLKFCVHELSKRQEKGQSKEQPPSMSAKWDKPDKQEAVQRHSSRFNTGHY